MALKADPTTPQVAKKASVIDEITVKLRAADAAVLTEYRGLTVAQIAELRTALRPSGTEYKIYKNTLVRRAAADAGIGEQLDALLTGPVAVAFIQGDAAAAAKALREFAKATPALVLKGGLLGERALSTSDVDALADLPPREQLLSQIAGLFEAPMAQTLGVLEALLRDTVGLVAALIEKQGGVQESEPEAVAAPEPEADAVAEAPEAETADEAPAEAPEAAASEPEAADAPEPESAPETPEAAE